MCGNNSRANSRCRSVMKMANQAGTFTPTAIGNTTIQFNSLCWATDTFLEETGKLTDCRQKRRLYCSKQCLKYAPPEHAFYSAVWLFIWICPYEYTAFKALVSLVHDTSSSASWFMYSPAGRLSRIASARVCPIGIRTRQMLPSWRSTVSHSLWTAYDANPFQAIHTRARYRANKSLPKIQNHFHSKKNWSMDCLKCKSVIMKLSVRMSEKLYETFTQDGTTVELRSALSTSQSSCQAVAQEGGLS
jgi:hypothetical protein